MDISPPIPPSANRPQRFNPDLLARSIIALPLLAQLDAEEIGRVWLADFLKKPRFRKRLDANKPTADETLALAERNLDWLQKQAANRTPEQVLSLLQEADLAPPVSGQAAWLTWFSGWLHQPVADPLPRLFAVIIDLNQRYPGGRPLARERVLALTKEIGATMQEGHRQALLVEADPKNKYVQQYVFARLEGPAIRRLAQRDAAAGVPAGLENRPDLAAPRAVYRIWPDFPIGATVNRSIATVKADAAQVSYAALGEGMVWAVMDSGIQEQHPHFARHHNLDLTLPLQHTDFSGPNNAPLVDVFGHGTHVAGIIAGEQRDLVPLDTPAAERTSPRTIHAYTLQRDEQGDTHYEAVPIQHISGIAPKCKLLSLKVLDDQGQGEASNLIAAIGLIQELNSHGRNLLVHGVNMSVGYEFKPEWFACGQSPLCVEVNRLVRSGVVVVVAAGNTGYGVAQSYEGKMRWSS